MFVVVVYGVVGVIVRDVVLKCGVDVMSVNVVFVKMFVVGFVGFVEAAFGGDDEDV